jgi:hypothetical protein
MFKLFRIHDDEYIIVRGRTSQVGSLIKTIQAMSQMGVDDHNIEAGLVSLQMNDHHVADYGVYLTFIYSLPLTG